MREDHWIGGEGAESSMRARLRLEAMEWHEEELLLVDDDDDESLSSPFNFGKRCDARRFRKGK